MDSRDRLKAIALIWGLFALLVGIICTVGGTQIEEVVLTLFLALIVFGATHELSGSDVFTRRVRQEVEKPKREESFDRLLEMATDDELDILRERLLDESAVQRSNLHPFSTS